MSKAEDTRKHFPLLNDRTTVVADSLCLIRDVHHRVHRSHERFHGAACDERRTPHGPAAGGRCCGIVLLGILAPADAGSVPGTTLERQANGWDSACGVGPLLDCNRPRAYAYAVQADEAGSGTRRRRSLAGGSCPGRTLVPSCGTRSRERLLDVVLTAFRRDFVSTLRMAAHALELACAPDRRRCLAVSVVARLAHEH